MKIGASQIASLKAELREKLEAQSEYRLCLQKLIQERGLCWAETHLLVIRLGHEGEFLIEDPLIGPDAEVLEVTIRFNFSRSRP